MAVEMLSLPRAPAQHDRPKGDYGMTSAPQVRNDFSLSLAGESGSIAPVQERLVSADSHVTEPPDRWVQRLPATRRDRAPRFPEQTAFTNQEIRGGSDPRARLREMETDGVVAEVLYPTLGLMLFRLEDAALQQACFRAYNDWLAEYCAVAPERLAGVPMISSYDIDAAVRELERYPRLKFEVVENEIGWMPFVVDQWDKYFRRWRAGQPLTIDKPPSEYMRRQVYATFFFDQVGGRNLSWWGAGNCMWSNDFPHPNTTWPNSRQVIARDLGHLPHDTLVKTDPRQRH